MDSLTDTKETGAFVDLDAVVLVRRDGTDAVGIDAKDEYIEKPVDPPIKAKKVDGTLVCDGVTVDLGTVVFNQHGILFTGCRLKGCVIESCSLDNCVCEKSQVLKCDVSGGVYSDHCLLDQCTVHGNVRIDSCAIMYGEISINGACPLERNDMVGVLFRNSNMVHVNKFGTLRDCIFQESSGDLYYTNVVDGDIVHVAEVLGGGTRVVYESDSDSGKLDAQDGRFGVSVLPAGGLLFNDLDEAIDHMAGLSESEKEYMAAWEDEPDSSIDIQVTHTDGSLYKILRDAVFEYKILYSQLHGGSYPSSEDSARFDTEFKPWFLDKTRDYDGSSSNIGTFSFDGEQIYVHMCDLDVYSDPPTESDPYGIRVVISASNARQGTISTDNVSAHSVYEAAVSTSEVTRALRESVCPTCMWNHKTDFDNLYNAWTTTTSTGSEIIYEEETAGEYDIQVTILYDGLVTFYGNPLKRLRDSVEAVRSAVARGDVAINGHVFLRYPSGTDVTGNVSTPRYIVYDPDVVERMKEDIVNIIEEEPDIDTLMGIAVTLQNYYDSMGLGADVPGGVNIFDGDVFKIIKWLTDYLRPTSEVSKNDPEFHKAVKEMYYGAGGGPGNNTQKCLGPSVPCGEGTSWSKEKCRCVPSSGDGKCPKRTCPDGMKWNEISCICVTPSDNDPPNGDICYLAIKHGRPCALHPVGAGTPEDIIRYVPCLPEYCHIPLNLKPKPTPTPKPPKDTVLKPKVTPKYHLKTTTGTCVYVSTLPNGNEVASTTAGKRSVMKCTADCDSECQKNLEINRYLWGCSFWGYYEWSGTWGWIGYKSSTGCRAGADPSRTKITFVGKTKR